MNSSAGATPDDEGWLSQARRVVSPNFDERPPGAVVSMLVVHAISLPPDEFGGDGILRFFSNTLDARLHPYFEQIAALRVSAHFLIRRDGELIQFVSCNQRAWHAGKSAWQGRERCNDFSIGVELEGSDTQAFVAAQYEQFNALLDCLRRRYPLKDILGHCDIAPGRKTDPGPHFDWTKLRGVHRSQA